MLTVKFSVHILRPSSATKRISVQPVQHGQHDCGAHNIGTSTPIHHSLQFLF